MKNYDQVSSEFHRFRRLAIVIAKKIFDLTANSPGDFLDADFLAFLLIVVIPLALRKVNTREGGGGVNSLGLPFALDCLHQHIQLRR
jgi:hypothetical protein